VTEPAEIQTLRIEKMRVVKREAAEYHITFERYGWIIAHLSDALGVLSICSDWGNWSYRWDPPHLGYPTLTEFLRDREFGSYDYLANKLIPLGRQDILDIVASRKSFKDAVCGMRRNSPKRLNRDDARDIWYEIEEWEGQDELPGSGHLDEPWELLKHKTSAEWDSLTQIVLPALRDALKESTLRKEATT
jgi:hypothetical protein